MHGPEILIPIISVVMFFGTIFGVYYIYRTAKHRERMELIKSGRNAGIFKETPTTRRYSALKWGLIMLGTGLGFFLGSIIQPVFGDVAIPGLTLIFGGIGLLVFYLITSKDEKYEQEEKINEEKELEDATV